VETRLKRKMREPSALLTPPTSPSLPVDATSVVTIQPPATHPHQPSARSLSYEDALDLGYCSSPEATEEGS
jgi:hypothetical protein